jgi:hypothetical protein
MRAVFPEPTGLLSFSKGSQPSIVNFDFNLESGDILLGST